MVPMWRVKKVDISIRTESTQCPYPYRNWAIPGLFYVYFRSFKQIIQFLQQIMVNNCSSSIPSMQHPVLGLVPHVLLSMSLWVINLCGWLSIDLCWITDLFGRNSKDCLDRYLCVTSWSVRGKVRVEVGSKGVETLQYQNNSWKSHRQKQPTL